MYIRSDVAFRGQTGLAMLNLSFVNPDPLLKFKRERLVWQCAGSTVHERAAYGGQRSAPYKWPGSDAAWRAWLLSMRGSFPEPLQLRRTTQAPPARRIFSQSASAATREGAGVCT